MRSRSRRKGGEYGASRGGRGVRASGRREERRRVCRVEGQGSAVDLEGHGAWEHRRKEEGQWSGSCRRARLMPLVYLCCQRPV